MLTIFNGHVQIEWKWERWEAKKVAKKSRNEKQKKKRNENKTQNPL